MARTSTNERASVLGDISAPSPRGRQWLLGGAAALAVHAIAAAPFLPAPEENTAPVIEAPAETNEIGVSLAPVVQPPEPPPETQPEPEQEIPVIEERATNSPPPAPPAEPRRIPDLPDIRPQAVPDLWRGASGGGTVTLDEYLLLRDWLSAARQAVLEQLSYPVEARRYGLSGSAVVAIVTTREGRITGWSFQQRTGEIILDKEIEDTIGRIRRLPKFPPGISYESLTFSLPIRFELVFQDRRGRAAPAPDESAAPGAQTPPQQQGLSAQSLAACASEAALLSGDRDAIESLRAEIEAERNEVDDLLDRYERENRNPPLRVRRRLDAYNERIEEYDARLGEFQTKAAAFSAQCGQGSATWDNYAQACGPYRTSGNIYCEAFGDLWLRLQAGP